MSTWTGPWRVANGDKERVYAVQHLVAAELRDVHVARTQVYADDKLEITGELLKVFQQLENQGEYHIRSIGYQAGCKRRRVRCQGGLGRTGGGGENLGACVARVPSRAGRAAQRAQGAAAKGGAGAGARAAVWVAFVILYIVIWGGVEDSELPIFWFSGFLTWNFCVERL